VATSLSLKSLRMKPDEMQGAQVTFTPEAILARLRASFNNPGLTLLTSGDLLWRADGPPSVVQVVQVDGRDYALILTPRPVPGTVNFKVGVVEKGGAEKIKKVLLDTEIVLPDREVAMLGFRDSRENSYFVAFYVRARKDSLAKDALRLPPGERPRKIKDAKPAYPAEAQEKGIEGTVVLEAVIGADGRVKAAQTLSSPAPVLAEAAKAAVNGWIYEPYRIKGKAKEVAFTVTMSFRLDKESKAKIDGNALARLEESQVPKTVKMVMPAYPEEARKNRIQGVVKLETVIDESGKVRALRTLESPDQNLTAAALAAVKVWEYEPFIQDGKAKGAIFTVIVSFVLR
jgi:TonB family protein